MRLSAGPSQFVNLPASLQTGHTRVHYADSPRNIGITFDDNLSMTEQVSQICQNAHLEIRRFLTHTVCVCVCVYVCVCVSVRVSVYKRVWRREWFGIVGVYPTWGLLATNRIDTGSGEHISSASMDTG